MNNLPFKRDTGIPFKRFGVRTDCSRNAVWNVPALKKWIDIISKLGYNTLTLYCEDTYEIEGEPYFGYGRGRFTKEELKELNAYAREREVEMIPGTNRNQRQHQPAVVQSRFQNMLRRAAAPLSWPL